MKRVRKIIAILLTVLMLMSVISAATPVLATEVTEIIEAESSEEYSEKIETESSEENSESTEADSTEESSETEEIVTEEEISAESEEPEILYEDTERRDEYTKHFVMSNGLNKAVKYAQPIHYKENGEWLDIDNTLEYNQETEKYENQANSFKVNFDEKINSEELFSIENKGYTMSWKYNSSTKSNGSAGKVEKHSDKKDKTEKYKPKPNGKIKYDKFEIDTNLEYIVTGTGVKENIILESYNGKNKFSFEVKAKDLEFIANEDKSISVVNQSGEEIFYIPAPFMFDAENNYSYDVDYSIESKNNKSIISVIADKDWLEDKERKYPVTIDPVIETEKTKSAIETTFVASGTPTTNYNGVGDIYIGVDSNTYDACRTLVKFELPTLKNSDMVVGATLGLWMYDTSFYLNTMPDKQINVHTITTEWDIENITWNTKPQIAPNVSDYNFIKKSDASYSKVEKGFDVTRTVKEWYEGTTENNGFLIKAAEEDGSYSQVAARAIFRSDNYENKEYMPYIEISYRNNKGLESYWDYSSFGVGVAGTAHINDYSGNLVYELPLASSSGEIMPIDIVGYYNNYCAGLLARDTQAENVRTSIGRGFRLNYQQTVLPSSEYIKSETFNKKYPYVYTDADGTEHYIQKVIENEGKDDEKTVYKDEDGLGLTLTTGLDENENKYYKIEDKAHNTYYFNFRGNLSRIKDKNGNEIKVIYKEADSNSNLLDRSRIDKIIDGAGHTYTFTYAKNSANKELDFVRTIKDDAGRVIDFDISEGLLTDVEFPGENYAHFDYEISKDDISEKRINAVYSNDIYELNFDYTSVKTGRRVKTVKEYSETGSKGQVITFDRSKYNTTVMRSCGLDGVHYTDDSSKGDDDIITTIQYDNMGRAISQQMKFGSGDEISAGSCAYTTSDSDETASGFKNKVSGSGATGKYVENLLYDGNTEDEYDFWAYDTAGSVDADRGISTASKYIGTSSLKLTINEVTGENGRCYYRQNFTSNVKPNTAYTLSAYVKVGDLVAYSKGDLKGAFIQIIGYDENGNAIDSVNSRSQIITERSDLDVNNGWRRLSCTVETNDDTKSLRCYLFLRNAEGSVCFDGIQLEKGDTANDYNMLQNSHFTEFGSESEPKFWSATGELEFSTGSTITNGVKTTSGTTGNDTKAMIITGSPDAEKGVAQTVEVDANLDDTYILSGWAKGFPVNTTYHTELTKGKDTETTDDDEYSGTALFEIAVKVKYSASDDSDPEEFKTPATFNTTITDWQCASVPISLKYSKAKDGVTYTPQSIKIIPRYHNQMNSVYFDKIMLVKDAASSYTYDDEGNILTASSNSEQESTMKYDKNNNLTSYKDTAGNTTKLTYDENNNLQTQKSAKGVKTEYTYNENGLHRTTEIHNNWLSIDSKKEGYVAPTAAIKTSQKYYTDVSGTDINEGAYIYANYDENQNKTSFTYDYETGNTLTVTNAKDVVKTNTYSGESTRPSTTTINNSRVYYSYEDGTNRLESIKFGKYSGGSFDSKRYEKYYFDYDKFGNVEETRVGSQYLSRNTYKENNGPLVTTEYGNGDSRRYSYNNFGQKIVDYVTDGNTEKKSYSWSYNDSGVNIRHTDYVNGLQYLFDYDSIGRLSKVETVDKDTKAFIGLTEYGYDVRDNLTNLVTNFGGNYQEQQYFYSSVDESSNSADYAADNLPTMYKLYDNRYATYSYDSLNRLNQRKFKLKDDAALYYNYIYKSSDRNAEGESLYRTTQVSKEFIGNDVYIYGYDVLGNITSIKTATRKSTDPSNANFKDYTGAKSYVSYKYDDLGQLTEENISDGKIRNIWTYDELGNIIRHIEYKKEKVITNPITNVPNEVEKSKDIQLGYGVDPDSDGDDKPEADWNRLLTTVTTIEYLDGVYWSTETESIDYDAIGNPTTYLGATLKWNGRQLTSYSKDDVSISYKYDADGLRSYKKLGSVTSKYFYANGNLHYEERSDGTKLYFYYDSNGYLSGIEYNGTNYYPATNRRGDVVAIYNNLGECVAKYEYDAWGNILSVTDASGSSITDQSHIANVNPIRYRGYYYDTETKLYYLQSRYYNPEVGRFLNADGYLTTGQGVLSYNMFAYCMNNPVINSDPSGMMCGLCMCTGVYPCPACMPPLPEINSINLLFGNVSIPTQPYIAPKSSTNNIADSISTTYDTMDTISGLQSGFYMNNNHYLINSAPSVAENFGKAVSIGLIGYETVTGVCNNYLAGATNKKIVWDAAVDVTVLGSTTWCCAATGAAICAKYGTMISPGIGTAYGAAGGALAGALFSLFSDDAIEYLKGLVK